MARAEFQGNQNIFAVSYAESCNLQIQVTNAEQPNGNQVSRPTYDSHTTTAFGTLTEAVLANGLARFRDVDCRIGYGAVYAVEGKKLEFFAPSIHELFPDGSEKESISRFLKLFTLVGVDKQGKPARVCDKQGVTPLLTEEQYAQAIKELGLPAIIEQPSPQVDEVYLQPPAKQQLIRG